ncbi:LOW QUALITY PROTEIN: N(4)-(beta-N-acetylglucosaminyl)-L-asparaginase-like [Styela clava]
MIMDGTTMNVGAVGSLRRIKNAIGVARAVFDHTSHTLLVGDQATSFAVKNRLLEETLSTNSSVEACNKWKTGNCQPNYRNNTTPDSKKFCGPYVPTVKMQNTRNQFVSDKYNILGNHDTIGILVIDKTGKIASGTSTNGKHFKVPGRVGDSPIPGAGSYADDTAGGAAATGDGDIMMRLLPSYQLVENMRQGMKPSDAAKDAIDRILKRYPTFSGALIGVNMRGDYGAACTGFNEFEYCVRTESKPQTTTKKKPQFFLSIVQMIQA